MFTKAKNAAQLIIAIAIVTQTIRGLGMMGRDAVHFVEERYFSKK